MIRKMMYKTQSKTKNPDPADSPPGASSAPTPSLKPAQRARLPSTFKNWAIKIASDQNNISKLVNKNGRIIYDLCKTFLKEPELAEAAFFQIFQNIRKSLHEGHNLIRYERAWILRLSCDWLLKNHVEVSASQTSSDQIKLDSNQNMMTRLKAFDFYFHRLSAEDQLILILQEKLQIPAHDIALALNLPEGSLKIRKQQALRALEEWIWLSR
jgi:DNA-directed RNA polymerase specialized sigma24 family protein